MTHSRPRGFGEQAPLAVGFDASAALVAEPTGVAAAIIQTARSLDAREDLRCRLYLRVSRFKNRRYLRRFGSIPRWWFAGPIYWRGSLQVFHGPDTRLPRRLPAGVKTVVTIHDFSALQGAGFCRKCFIETRLRHYECAKEADHIVVYSKAMAKEVEHRLSIPAFRISVVGLAPALTDADLSSGRAKTGTAEVKKSGHSRFEHPKPYFLLLGELSKRKATAEAIAAYSEARKTTSELKDIDLFIVGRVGFGAEAATQLIDHKPPGVRYLGYLPRAQAAQALSQAKALLFPSRYEGFGLPVLEAMNFGIPVIAGNCLALEELVGEAGLIVNPDSQESLTRAITTIAKEPEHAKDLSRRGRARAAGWTWQRTAANLRAIYYKLIEARSN